MSHRKLVWKSCNDQARAAVEDASYPPLRWCSRCGATRTASLLPGPDGERTLCIQYVPACPGVRFVKLFISSCGQLFAEIERRRQDPVWSRSRVSIASLIADDDAGGEISPRREKASPLAPVGVDDVKPPQVPDATPAAPAAAERKRKKQQYGSEGERWKIVAVFKEHPLCGKKS